jgi:hypothetical protein
MYRLGLLGVVANMSRMRTDRTVPFLISASLMSAALLMALPSFGKDNSKKKRSDNQSGSPPASQDAKVDRHRGFSEQERQTIQVYVQKYGGQEGKHSRKLPPGLAKKLARGGNLPPGWEKKCVPGEIMPVEVFEECRPLPRELVVQLPPPPEATITVAVDGRVVRILEATRQILDVFNIRLPF